MFTKCTDAQWNQTSVLYFVSSFNSTSYNCQATKSVCKRLVDYILLAEFLRSSEPRNWQTHFVDVVYLLIWYKTL